MTTNVLRSKAALLSSAVAVIAAGAAALMPTAALAAGVDDLGLTPHLNGFLGILSGPIAKTVCAILILCCVVAFWRGHDMGETIPKLAVVVFGIACLILIVGATNSIAGTGAMIPDLPQHVAIHHQLIPLHIK